MLDTLLVFAALAAVAVGVPLLMLWREITGTRPAVMNDSDGIIG
jgi:hypothetical protein